MGLLDKLNSGLKAVGKISGMPSMEEPSSLGKVPVGKQKKFDLPAGKVELWYQIPRTEVFDTGGENDPVLVEPGDLTVTVKPAKGKALSVDHGSGSNSSQDLKHQRCKVGTVEVPAAGSYTVESSSQEAPGAADLLLDG